MSEFRINTSNLRNGSVDEQQIVQKIRELSSEISSITNALKVDSSAVESIRQTLGCNIKGLEDSKEKVVAMERALDDIISLYESVEGKAKYEMDNSVPKRIRDAVNSLYSIITSLGLIPGALFSKDPVNLCTGNYVYEKELLNMDFPIPFMFRIFYNSVGDVEGVLGRGWLHNYETHLYFQGNKVIIELSDGSLLQFKKDENGIYHNMKGTFGVLQAVEEGYKYENRYFVSNFFDSVGRLSGYEDRNGNKVILVYDDSQRLTKVETNYGEYFEFQYNQNGEIIRIIDHAGRLIGFEYSDGRLEKVEDVLGNANIYQYNEEGVLNAILNSRGEAVLINTYKGGRTVEQKFIDGGVVRYQYDDENQISVMTEQNGNQIKYVHDEYYRGVENIYEDGNEIYEYNDNDQCTVHVDKNGNRTEYSYNRFGNIIQVKNALGETQRFVYDDGGLPIQFWLNDKLRCEARYNNGRHVWMRDALGNETNYEYNAHGQVTKIIAADGATICFEYDEKGNCIKESNLFGGITKYDYDNLRRMVVKIDPKGNRTNYEYDAAGHLVAEINAKNEKKQYFYDTCGNRIKTIDACGNITEAHYNKINKLERIVNEVGDNVLLFYDRCWNLIKKIDMDGGITEYHYNQLQQLTEIVYPNGAKETARYDACGNLVKRIDPNGGEYLFTYDALDRVTAVQDPIGAVQRVVLNEYGNVETWIQADGSRRENRYDILGNLISETNTLGYTKKYQYDKNSVLVSKSDQQGILEKYEYYPGGVLKKQIRADGTSLLYEYDICGNITSIENEHGFRIEFIYDELNRIIKVSSQEGVLEEYKYDARGNIITIMDENGNKTERTYSAANQLTEIKTPNGVRTKYYYDVMQRISKVVRNDGKVFEEYVRDLMGNVTSIKDTLGNITSYQYDGNGHLTSITDADGYRTLFSYYADGMQKKICLSDGRKISVKYNLLKSLEEMTDWNGTTKVSSDSEKRVKKIVGFRGEQMQYEYNSRGGRTRQVYPDKSDIRYIYDNAGRLQRCIQGASEVQYIYGIGNWVVEKRYPNDFCMKYQYDIKGNVQIETLQKGSQIIDQISYEYDKAGKLTGQKRRYLANALAKSWSYTYDTLGRLDSVRKDGEVYQTFEYDSFGNLVKEFKGDRIIRYQYNGAGQLTEKDAGDRCYQYTYDKRGNMIQEEVNGDRTCNWEYDALNKMKSVVTNSQIYNYEYDGFGMRISEKADDRIRLEVRDLTKRYDNLCQIYENGKDQKSYYWDTSLMKKVEGEREEYYFLDRLHSPMTIFDVHSILGQKEYDPFGVSNKDIPYMDFLFASYQTMGFDKQLYAQQRTYMPENKRFMQKDLVGGDLFRPATMDPYVYCLYSPLNYTDYSGMIAISLLIAAGIAGTIFNVGPQLVEDISTSIGKGEASFSSWETYVAKASSGIIQGVGTVTGGEKAGSVLGAMTESLVQGGLEMVSGKREFSANEVGKLAWETAENTLESIVLGRIASKIKVPGINQGRNSCEAVWKQLITKYQNNQIKNISWKSITKGLVANGYGAIIDEIVKKHYDSVKDLLEYFSRGCGKGDSAQCPLL